MGRTNWSVVVCRFPNLFPPLKPEVVARRTVEAVQQNQAFLLLPWTMHILVILKRYCLRFANPPLGPRRLGTQLEYHLGTIQLSILLCLFATQSDQRPFSRKLISKAGRPPLSQQSIAQRKAACEQGGSSEVWIEPKKSLFNLSCFSIGGRATSVGRSHLELEGTPPACGRIPAPLPPFYRHFVN